MIKIIKPGKLQVVTCPICECEFSFENEDIKCGRDPYKEVECPYCKNHIDLRKIKSLVEAYDSFKKDYETRLKADMVTVLTDLQSDVEGQKFDVHIDKDVWNDAIGVCLELIQQKIDALRAESELQESEGNNAEVNRR